MVIGRFVEVCQRKDLKVIAGKGDRIILEGGRLGV